MNMTRVYETLLRLYPADYKAAFAAEMVNVFERAAHKSRKQGWSSYIRFPAAELSGLIRGACREWIAKLTTDSSVRGRCLPDLRMMRPPGVPRELWFAGASPWIPHAHRTSGRRSQHQAC